MKLIPKWKQAWKYLSVQLMTLGTAISSTYAVMFQQLRDVIDPKMMAMITAGVFISGIVGRVLSQGVEDDSQ